MKSLVAGEMERYKMTRKELINLLADLLFAYTNKDDGFTHDFEIEAVKTTCIVLQREYTGGKYTEHFINETLKKYGTGYEP